jgi:regulator of protease activity HflC (stomatin/prohibitin superfamily)
MRVDLRIQVIEIATQDVISRDNVSMKVDAVLYFNVSQSRTSDHSSSILPSRHKHARADDAARRAGQHELDEMLSERKKLSTDVQSILDTQTETWGIKRLVGDINRNRGRDRGHSR